jgi:hypothetical protein
MTFLFQVHGLRWPAWGGGPLAAFVTFGPITVGGCPYVLTDRLKHLKDAISRAVKGD